MGNYSYVPILKWKRGEQNALKFLPNAIKDMMIPLIEIPTIDYDYKNRTYKKTIDQHIEDTASQIKKCWGDKNRIFLDLRILEEDGLITNTKTGDHPIKFILDKCRGLNLKVVPVIASNNDPAYKAEIVKVMRADKMGACIRLTDADFANVDKSIKAILSESKISPRDADLIIDFRYILPGSENREARMAIDIFGRIPFIEQWRTLTFAGTSFPVDLSNVAPQSVEKIDRLEWIIWQAIRNGNLKRTPFYGDFAIAHPEIKKVDPRLMIRSASIRYTYDNYWLVLKGRSIKKYGSKQYFNLADALIKKPEYKGYNYSYGDKYIYECSKKRDKTGSGETWRMVGTNHHLTLVVNQLSSFS